MPSLPPEGIADLVASCILYLFMQINYHVSVPPDIPASFPF